MLTCGTSTTAELLADVNTNTKYRDAIIALYKAQGYNDVFFFADGFTYTESNDVGIYEDGTAWTYADAGALPVTITAGTEPSEGVYKQIRLSDKFSNLQTEVLGGGVYPLDTTGVAEVGDSAYECDYIRLLGGDFEKTTLFPIVKKTGGGGVSGVISDINLTSKPYSAVVGGDECWLLDMKYYNLPIKGLSVKAFWVAADDSTTDDEPFQAALDYQRESFISLSLPAATIKTVYPMIIWCNNSDLTKTANPKIYGAGRGASVVRKSSRIGSTLINHEGISSVFIIANDYSREGSTVTVSSEASQTASYFGTLSGVTLKGDSPDSTRVSYGWYSLGLFYWNFDDVEMEGVETACATQYWNVFCNYKRLEMQLTGNGCDFGRANFGGNSNLYFEECHCNGINGFCYSILANATFIGCTIDGGGGTHYVIPGVDRGEAGILGGVITLIDCKSESQATFDTKHIFDISYGRVAAKNCSIEIPTLNFSAASSLVNAKNYSKFVTDDCRFNVRLGGPSASPGQLYSTDGTSRVNFDSETYINTEWFGEYKKVFYNPSDKFIIANRDKNDVSTDNITKFIYVVSSAVPAGERTVTSVSFSDDRIQIDCSQSNGHTMANGVMFNEPVDLTNYSKVRIQGDNTFLDGDGSGVNYQVYLNSTLISDGSVGVGSALPMDYKLTTSGEKAGNFSDTDFDRYVDVSDINGVYYIGLELFGTSISSNIQELSLVR